MTAHLHLVDLSINWLLSKICFRLTEKLFADKKGLVPIRVSVIVSLGMKNEININSS